MDHIDQLRRRVRRLVDSDPYLAPYAGRVVGRLSRGQRILRQMAPGDDGLHNATTRHTYFGLHRDSDGWVFREWAPFAEAVYLVGEHTGWEALPTGALERRDNGVWVLRLPESALAHGMLYRLRMHWPGGSGDRIPAFARRVVQDTASGIFNAQVWAPEFPHQWRHTSPDSTGALLIYEAHVGMAQEAERVGTYDEFREHVLPRIADAGYNTIQLMAIPEHPYYGSFGYQVSSFFAPSSRFGTPDEFKALVDAAHGHGLQVVMDLVHSHAVTNEVEGLSRFDGSRALYFHDGPRGDHPAWGSRCFDYGKSEVVAFLLSNCRYWLEEFQVDGYRFDGVTSMIYHHRGLNTSFASYADYFGDDVDEDAMAYLYLANQFVHGFRPGAITIAEDVSGMPGLAFPQEDGGIGFDFRFAMGVPDYWIRLTKDTPDEDWPVGGLWHELTNRRPGEGAISYAESHDQAMVGDQTLIFRLIGAHMYDSMSADSRNLAVERGMALHKMIRLITLFSAGGGYLNFMGNEFGHPEWIDFPREGNDWSYRYARRQWGLAENPVLRFQFLSRFDRDMIRLADRSRALNSGPPDLQLVHESDKVIAFRRGSLLLAFNFHPERSWTDYPVPSPPGQWRHVLDTDIRDYGGHGQIAPEQVYHALPGEHGGPAAGIRIYLPARTALVMDSAG